MLETLVLPNPEEYLSGIALTRVDYASIHVDRDYVSQMGVPGGEKQWVRQRP